MSDIRDVLDRAGLDPDPVFVADLERRLASPVEPQPADELAHRRRRWVAVAILASAAAVAAVAIVLTAGGRSRVVTTPGTEPVPSSVAAPTTVAPAPTTSPPPPTTSAPPVDLSSFSPSSVTFVSPTKAWVLGVDGRLVTTDDRGATWQVVQARQAKPGDQGNVPRVRFANSNVGYVFGGDLWSTHDAAVTWQQVTVPGADDASEYVALETADGTTYAIFTTSDGFRIASSAVGQDDWKLDPLVVPYGAGPVPHVQLVLQHGAGWLIENDRVVTAGARLVGGTWSEWTPPCMDGGGPATLGASSATDVVAICQEGIWGGPSTPTTRLYESADGGVTFTAAPGEIAEPTTADVQAVATAEPTTVVVGVTTSDGVSLQATFDGGQTWAAVWTGAGAAWVDLGFTTKTQGVAVLRQGALLLTSDGGHHWNEVPFEA
jgi:photosystem II stability/assembly factor-like uncharacterized protein